MSSGTRPLFDAASRDELMYLQRKAAGTVLSTLHGPTGPVTSLTTSHATLFAGSWDQSVYAYSLPSLTPTRVFTDGHSDFVKAVAVATVKVSQSTTNESTAVGFVDLLISGGADGYVVVWNAETGEKLHILRGHTRGVLDLAVQIHYDPISRSREVGEECVVWSAGSAREVRRWSISLYKARAVPYALTSAEVKEGGGENGKLEEEWTPHETSVNRLRFNIHESTMTDGHVVLNLLTASSDNTAKLSTLTCDSEHAAPVEQATFAHADFVRDALLLPSGLMATACRDENVRLWDPEGADEEEAVFDGHFEEVTSLCTVTVEGETWLLSGSIDGTTRVWPADGEAIERWKRARQKEALEGKLNGVNSEPQPGEEKTRKSVQLTEDEERELAELMEDD